MKTFIRLVILCCLVQQAHAQSDSANTHRKCLFGVMGNLHPDVENHFKTDSAEIDSGQFFIIPVVVHIIHNGGPENIPDNAVLSQIDVLNEDFGRYGAGTNSNPVGGDSRIRFCLASLDPNGNPTTGIEHIKSSFTDLKTDQEMSTKNLSRWDQKRYMNIWIVKTIDNNGENQGYSYLAASAAGKEFDGLVVVWKYFGRNMSYNPASYRGGRTTTHEVGHYLNLLHTWGHDGQGQGGCNDDDGIYDTPDCDGPYFSRFLPLQDSCTKPLQCGNYRMIENYMDYSEDRCMNIFTNGQTFKMRDAIRNYRSSIVSYTSSIVTGCQLNFQKFNPPGEDQLTVISNPEQQRIRFVPYFKNSETTAISIFDALGRIIKSSSVTLKDGIFDVECPELANGVYFSVLKTSKQTFTNKILWY